MTIYIGADHAGFALKQDIKEFLVHQGHNVQDMGAYKLDPDDDFPDFAAAVAREVVFHEGSMGIVICGTAEGICIAANKVRGIRAVTSHSLKAVELSRRQDNANVLCLAGGQTKIPVPEIATSPEWAQEVIKVWLATPFSNEARHVRRLEKIEKLEART